MERTRKLRVGDPLDEATEYGAVVSEGHMAKVLGCIEQAKEEGGKILCGGQGLAGIDGLRSHQLIALRLDPLGDAGHNLATLHRRRLAPTGKGRLCRGDGLVQIFLVGIGNPRVRTSRGGFEILDVAPGAWRPQFTAHEIANVFHAGWTRSERSTRNSREAKEEVYSSCAAWRTTRPRSLSSEPSATRRRRKPLLRSSCRAVRAVPRRPTSAPAFFP